MEYPLRRMTPPIQHVAADSQTFRNLRYCSFTAVTHPNRALLEFFIIFSTCFRHHDKFLFSIAFSLITLSSIFTPALFFLHLRVLLLPYAAIFCPKGYYSERGDRNYELSNQVESHAVNDAIDSLF
ncbi:MAG: hypothetical protein PHE09_13440 [Oscillospiraceae bacterium]|nr:hypothetical protein [Oscillospiraceae bacterium]